MDLLSTDRAPTTEPSWHSFPFPEKPKVTKRAPAAEVISPHIALKEHTHAVPAWLDALPTKECPSYAKRVYGAIITSFRMKHRFKSERLYAQDLGISVRHFQRGLKILVDNGWVSVTDRRKTCKANLYQFHDNPERKVSWHTEHLEDKEGPLPVAPYMWPRQECRLGSSDLTTPASPLIDTLTCIDIKKEKTKKETPEEARLFESRNKAPGSRESESACGESLSAGYSSSSARDALRQKAKYMNSNGNDGQRPKPKWMDDPNHGAAKPKTPTTSVSKIEALPVEEDLGSEPEPVPGWKKLEQTKKTMASASAHSIPNMDKKAAKQAATASKTQTASQAQVRSLEALWKHEIDQIGQLVIGMSAKDRGIISSMVARTNVEVVSAVIKFSIRHWEQVFTYCWPKRTADGAPRLGFITYNFEKIARAAVIWAKYEQVIGQEKKDAPAPASASGKFDVAAYFANAGTPTKNEEYETARAELKKVGFVL